MGEKVQYFAFAALMMKQRLDKPSAKLKTVAKLEGYSLGFAHYSDLWLGCQGTLVKGGHVWGCVWEMDPEDFEKLNEEEDVPATADLIDVEVTTREGQKLRCKAYRPIPQEPIPDNPLPSPQYMDLIIRGSIQNGIPDEYLDKLKEVETNHNTKPVAPHEEAMKKLFGRR